MLEDRRLVWKLKRGDRGALCRIYDMHREKLLRTAAGLLDSVSDAEDVVHDVFLAFVRSAAGFELRRGSLGAYLATCVANRARNMNRARRRRPAVGLDEVDETACPSRRPEAWIVLDEQFARLREALGQLPDEQREAVILRAEGGLKFREIARVQETTLKTALSRYRYGLDKLRSILKDEVAHETDR